MDKKVIWYIEIYSCYTDIKGGVVYAMTQKEAKARLKELMAEDLDELKSKEPKRYWYTIMENYGMGGDIHSWLDEPNAPYFKGVFYTIHSKRVPA